MRGQFFRTPDPYTGWLQSPATVLHEAPFMVVSTHAVGVSVEPAVGIAVGAVVLAVALVGDEVGAAVGAELFMPGHA